MALPDGFVAADRDTPMRIGDQFITRIHFKPGVYQNFQEARDQIVSEIAKKQRNPEEIWSKVHITYVSGAVLSPPIGEPDLGPYVQIEGTVTKNPWPALLLYVAVVAIVGFLLLNIGTVNIFVKKTIEAATNVVEAAGAAAKSIGNFAPLILIGLAVFAVVYFFPKRGKT